MQACAFDFSLPADRIALHPAAPRDSARLLDVGETLCDRRICDLPAMLEPGDLLVVNDTRVIPARLAGVRRRGEAAGAAVEVTLHTRRDAASWRAFARPARRLAPGDRITFADGLEAQVKERQGADVLLAFTASGPDLSEAIARHGRTPLPPYIARRRAPSARDAADYQTLFAAKDGAVAAPTAGLHFTPDLVARLRARGVVLAALTLHVGPGTFAPVRAPVRSGSLRTAGERPAATDQVFREWGELRPETAARINAARRAGGRIVAVGTTSLRLLETAADDAGSVRPFRGASGLIIAPGYHVRAADALLTNFHLPRSTLFMLVCAFAGTQRMQAAYAHAIGCGYRFYSYGDACLLWPSGGGPP